MGPNLINLPCKYLYFSPYVRHFERLRSNRLPGVDAGVTVSGLDEEAVRTGVHGPEVGDTRSGIDGIGITDWMTEESTH